MLRQEEKDNGSADYYKTLKNRAKAPGNENGKGERAKDRNREGNVKGIAEEAGEERIEIAEDNGSRIQRDRDRDRDRDGGKDRKRHR